MSFIQWSRHFFLFVRFRFNFWLFFFHFLNNLFEHLFFSLDATQSGSVKLSDLARLLSYLDFTETCEERERYIAGGEAVMAAGGEVRVLNFEDGVSTTAMIDTILDREG